MAELVSEPLSPLPSEAMEVGEEPEYHGCAPVLGVPIAILCPVSHCPPLNCSLDSIGQARVSLWCIAAATPVVVITV